MPPANAVSSTRYLTFRVGAGHYALPAVAVSEVVRLGSLARVPQGPEALLGVANLRGSVVPVVGLQELLQLGPSPPVPERLTLVLDHATPTALVIDEVETLEDVSGERLEPADGTWQTQAGERIQGAFKRGQSQELTKILDIEALLAHAFATRGSAPRAERAPSARVHRATESAPGGSEMLLTFEVCGQEFAFPLTAIDELLPLPASVSTTSRSDSVILGFTSIRSSLVPLLSLRGLLGFDAASASTGREKVLILKVAGAPVGLVVDDARSVVSAQTSLMEPVPAVLVARAGGESRIRAVYRGDGGRRLVSILAPELLFRDDIMQRLAKVAHHVQSKAETAAAGAESIFLVFRLGADEFGLPIDSVVEVAPMPLQITRVPKTPKFLEGVINLRGDVLPLVDQRRRFDMPTHEDPARRLVIVKTAQLRAALIVDSVTDVLRTPSDSVSPPPQLTSQISRLVHGVVNLQASGRLVLLLDPLELLTRAEQGQLDTFQAAGKKARA